MNAESRSTDVVVLVADGLVYEGVDYASRIEEQLSAAGLKSCRYDLTKSSDAKLPSGRAYILTGGITSVHSDAEWMRSAVVLTQHLIQNADQDRYTVIGICLGSQIIAEALRPNSIIASENIEVGLAAIERPGETRAQQVVPAFHYQAIAPAIATVEGVSIDWCNAHTAVQAFSLGERIWGYQFHPELNTTDIHHLIDYNSSVITEWGGDVELAHRSVNKRAADLSADLFQQMVIERIAPQDCGLSSDH